MNGFTRVVVLSLLLTACSTGPQQKKEESGPHAAQPAVVNIQSGVSGAQSGKIKMNTEGAGTGNASPQPEQNSAPLYQFKKGLLEKVMSTGDQEGWIKIGTEDGITTYRKELENGDVAFRGEVNVPSSILKIAGVFDDPTIRKDWIDALVDARVLRQSDRLHRVEYNHTAVPWPFQDRDFVYDVAIELGRNPSSMLFRMKSVEDDLAPVKSGVVRAKLQYCYYYIAEIKPNELTRVVVEVAIDPMGAIPKWLVNLNQKKWPQNTLAGLRKLALKPETVIPIDLEEYFRTGLKSPKKEAKK